MIPRLSQVETTEAIYLQFIEALQKAGFAGDLNQDYANRIVLSTDNSIYQMLPQGVLYPKSTNDLVLIAKLADESRFAEVKLSARGGGTRY